MCAVFHVPCVLCTYCALMPAVWCAAHMSPTDPLLPPGLSSPRPPLCLSALGNGLSYPPTVIYKAPCLFLAIIKERVGGGIPQPCNFPLKWPRLSKTHWMILAPPNPNFQKKRHPHPLIYLWGITTSLYNVIKKVTNISIYLSQVICSIENLVFSCNCFLF